MWNFKTPSHYGEARWEKCIGILDGIHLEDSLWMFDEQMIGRQCPSDGDLSFADTSDRDSEVVVK